MAKKTGFKGALTIDIKERIFLKDILKERRANEKRMDAIIKKFQNRKKKK